MNNSNSTPGCLIGLVIIAALAGLIFWRAENSTQLWTMLGILAVAVILMALGRYANVNRQEGLGCFIMGWGLLLVGGVSYFVITGNFESTSGFLSRLGVLTPTPVVVTATPTAVAAASTPPTSPATPTATSMPALAATEQPPEQSNENGQVTDVAWWQADPQYAQTLTPELEQWRLYGLIILGVQYLTIVWVAFRTKHRYVGCSIIGMIVSALLTFTKLGEWTYWVVLWLFSWGIFGKIVALLLAASSGSYGMGNLSALIIGGYLYYDREVFLWCLAPSVVIAFIALIIRVRQALWGHRYLE